MQPIVENYVSVNFIRLFLHVIMRKYYTHSILLFLSLTFARYNMQKKSYKDTLCLIFLHTVLCQHQTDNKQIMMRTK
jgi:hypothetical protein